MDPLLLAIALLGFCTVVFAAVGMRAAFARRSEEVLERITRAVQLGSPGAAPVEPQAGASFWGQLLAPFARLAKPREQSEDYSRVRTQLIRAAFRGPRAVEAFFGAKVFLALLFTGALVAAANLTVRGIPNLHLWLVVAAAAGFYAPNLWLRRKVTSRQTAISRSLPDAMDLLVTCVEAGLGLEAALNRITREIGLSSPELASELQQMVMEIQAGVVRADAFRRLADRTGLEELRSLAAILIQTEMFGSSIGKALRVHSSAMRVRRTHRAEERAAKVAVKMLMPLILCILPSLFSIILGPAVVRIVTQLLPALNGEPQ